MQNFHSYISTYYLHNEIDPYSWEAVHIHVIKSNEDIKSNTTVNKRGKSGYPCIIPDLRRKAFSFSPLTKMSAVACHMWPLLY